MIVGSLFVSFFNYFQKLRKYEINEEYNAKRGSEPSKTLDCCIDFSLNFCVFSKPPSRAHFWRSKRPSILKSMILERFVIFLVSQK